ncbi:MAG: ABC-type amino acid transport substrate-binding protein [Pseudomonas sp.]
MAAVRMVPALLCFALSCLAAHTALAGQLVKVGAYNFPPYVVQAESTQPQGLLPDLLAMLNRQQSDYHFELVPTSVTRRYRDFKSTRFDLMLFEPQAWGWQGTPMDVLDLHVDDAEIYVAKAEPGRGQEYFEQIKGKRLALYTGYHYGFASFNTDSAYLAREYNAMLNYSHESNLLMVRRGRADMTVVTRSYLHRFQQMYPEMRAQLLASTKVDQVYHHDALLRQQGPVSLAELDRLLQQLRSDGQLAQLFSQYQLLTLTAGMKR